MRGDILSLPSTFPWRGAAWYSDEATGWTTGFQILAGAMKGFFSLPPRPHRLWGPPASYLVGTGGFLPGSKATGT